MLSTLEFGSEATTGSLIRRISSTQSYRHTRRICIPIRIDRTKLFISLCFVILIGVKFFAFSFPYPFVFLDGDKIEMSCFLPSGYSFRSWSHPVVFREQ